MVVMGIRTKQNSIKQQSETLAYFDQKADGWDEKVRGKVKTRVNVQRQRNDYVLAVLGERQETRYALDIGCGVGDLVIAMADRGVNVTGIDFASSMIDIAHQRLAKSKVQIAEFIATDYFDWHVDEEAYDIISANGFIEYISFEQRDEFLIDSLRGLKVGGSLVISSRNRLFNLFSLNEFTKNEVNGDGIERLLMEALALVDGKSIESLLEIKTVALPDPNIEYVNTGVNVVTRYQYTPAQLMQLIGRVGFDVIDVSPIHIHGVLPIFKEKYPAVHATIANRMQEFGFNNRSLLPHASAFMIHARKKSR